MQAAAHVAKSIASDTSGSPSRTVLPVSWAITAIVRPRSAAITSAMRHSAARRSAVVVAAQRAAPARRTGDDVVDLGRCREQRRQLGRLVGGEVGGDPGPVGCAA